MAACCAGSQHGQRQGLLEAGFPQRPPQKPVLLRAAALRKCGGHGCGHVPFRNHQRSLEKCLPSNTHDVQGTAVALSSLGPGPPPGLWLHSALLLPSPAQAGCGMGGWGVPDTCHHRSQTRPLAAVGAAECPGPRL